MKGESSIILGIVVFSVILFLPVFVIVGELLQSMRENAKRMIAYANGNYIYSTIMRESIEQTDTPKNALQRFREMVSKQLIQEAAAQNMAATNQVTQEFEKAKRDLH